MNKNPEGAVIDFENEEFLEEVLLQLMAYCHRRLSYSSLREAQNIDDLSYDLASEAIARHIENPENFKPEKSKNSNLKLVFLNYLKMYVLSSLIYNYQGKKKNINEVAFEHKSHFHLLSESLSIDTKIDYDAFVCTLQDLLIENEEGELFDFFVERYVKDSTREEVIKSLGISGQEYINRYKKLDRRIKSINTKPL